MRYSDLLGKIGCRLHCCNAAFSCIALFHCCPKLLTDMLSVVVSEHRQTLQVEQSSKPSLQLTQFYRQGYKALLRVVRIVITTFCYHLYKNSFFLLHEEKCVKLTAISLNCDSAESQAISEVLI